MARFALLLLGIVAMMFLSMYDVTRPGRRLSQRFGSLGTLAGRREGEIVAAVGPPVSRSAMVNGYLLQWQATGFHIALMFGLDGVCLGVTHQYIAQEAQTSGCLSVLF